MLHQAEANASTPQERMKFSNQIAQLDAKKRAVIQDPDANGKLKRVKKCGAKNKGRRSTNEKSAEDVDMDASDDDDDDAMQLLEMAGAHQPAVTAEAAPKLAVSELAVSAINGHPLDAPLDAILIADTGSATPAAAGSSSPPSSPLQSTSTAAVVKTPTASSKSKCSSPNENGGSSSSEPTGLKISPSNRKISLGTKKYDVADSQRVRSSSLGSLQDEGEQPEVDPVATEVST